MADVRELHRRTMLIAQGVVDRVSVDDLGSPTPCAGWTLRDLLAHMTGQNHGFAAAARGAGPDVALWVDRPVGDDPSGVFGASVSDVLDAFATSTESEWWLAEFSAERRFPAEQATGFHLLDYLVHAWDVAVSIGVPVVFDAEIEDAVLAVALAVPDGPGRSRPGASFAPALASEPSMTTMDRILVHLGRLPDWSP